jgi:hypothetical protein
MKIYVGNVVVVVATLGHFVAAALTLAEPEMLSMLQLFEILKLQLAQYAAEAAKEAHQILLLMLLLQSRIGHFYHICNDWWLLRCLGDAGAKPCAPTSPIDMINDIRMTRVTIWKNIL